jgi:hypothetical protein
MYQYWLIGEFNEGLGPEERERSETRPIATN